MKKIYTNYIANFRGLSREIWLLALVTFINRAGAMVIPFLSLYLINVEGFTLPQVGWIMSCFGLGSLVGTYIGGKLTDTIGFYKVILASLFMGGVGFVLLQFIDTFYGFCIGIFILTLMADAARPAIYVAADTYSKPGNTTRSITLIRLAINLGFSIGPLVGGLIIAHINYTSLFWIDGMTCIAASLGVFLLLKPKKQKDTKAEKEIIIKEGVPPYLNKLYIMFFLIMVANSLAFVQYFSVMPVYYEKAHFLSEDLIGWLMFINGATIVVFEMPLIAWLDRKKISKTMATFWGIFFLGISFMVLNFTSWSGVLVIAMFLMTLGEMIGFPFSNSLALEMAPKGRKGSYMAFYSMSFSIAHLIGHNGGMNMVNNFGYFNTWNVITIFLLVVACFTIWLYFLLKKSESQKKVT
ncbi:arabinose efflux permease family protein [Aequorivita sublithincola DSM 14238]|uniref:Arabinose efflux permease family protein n=1 Tax=Aequorivita sublithincola (strain DSM 14238 / LMG 21431 / ACAM 643 / 9-3) TaxID=746697 RepID=I3YSD2_AEQSU|nr:MFS transporter [Aequorivita sublithincola]AFL79900.1 arabinose efflux permease family protein [Aequorivita sublithincola DSM 14238]